MNDIIKIVQALKNSNILLKGVTETIENKKKEQKEGFLCRLLCNLGASLLEIILAGKGLVRAAYGNKTGLLMPPHALTNFEIQKYYQLEPRFNGVYSRNNLLKKIKDGAYVINLGQYAAVGTHYAALFCKGNGILYYDNFGVEHIPGEIQEFVENKNIKANIFRVQPNNSVMRGYFCFGFIDFMLAGKKLTDFTSLFFPQGLQNW